MSDRFKAPDAEESVACNLIPMIDIMFLLLLFFMLGADMSAREMEDVDLPKADQVKDEDKTQEVGYGGRTNVNIFHSHTTSGFTCPVHAAGNICRDMTHWRIAIRHDQFTIDTVGAQLKEDALLSLEEPDPKAGGKPLSKREVAIRADKNAPYGFIQKVIESCAAVGLYRIIVGAVRPEAG